MSIVICKDAVIDGKVKFSANCVVNVKAKILAEGGPIVFGENNIVEECVCIRNTHSSALVIGGGNIFEIGCQIDSVECIGDNNLFETRSSVEPGCVIGSNCIIGAKTRVKENTTLSENTVVSLPFNSITHSPSLNLSQQTNTIEIIKRLLMKYHQLQKVDENGNICHK